VIVHRVPAGVAERRVDAGGSVWCSSRRDGTVAAFVASERQGPSSAAAVVGGLGMRARPGTVGLAALASVLLAGSSSCAATSCPGVYLNPIVHVDATAWAGATVTSAGLRATVCVASNCVTATPINQATPGDLLGAVTLPTGKATVRVQITTSAGRTLDQSSTAEVTVTKPFGSGCAGREEIDLTVTEAGSLVPGRSANVS
jgi:hypothetical protein